MARSASQDPTLGAKGALARSARRGYLDIMASGQIGRGARLGYVPWGQVNNMVTTDELMGIKKPDLNEMKEVKVKLPVRQLLKLHYMKLTSSRTFSDVVSEALGDYFGALETARAEAA